MSPLSSPVPFILTRLALAPRPVSLAPCAHDLFRGVRLPSQRSLLIFGPDLTADLDRLEGDRSPLRPFIFCLDCFFFRIKVDAAFFLDPTTAGITRKSIDLRPPVTNDLFTNILASPKA